MEAFGNGSKFRGGKSDVLLLLGISKIFSD